MSQPHSRQMLKDRPLRPFQSGPLLQFIATDMRLWRQLRKSVCVIDSEPVEGSPTGTQKMICFFLLYDVTGGTKSLRGSCAPKSARDEAPLPTWISEISTPLCHRGMLELAARTHLL